MREKKIQLAALKFLKLKVPEKEKNFVANEKEVKNQ